MAATIVAAIIAAAATTVTGVISGVQTAEAGDEAAALNEREFAHRAEREKVSDSAARRQFGMQLAQMKSTETANYLQRMNERKAMKKVDQDKLFNNMTSRAATDVGLKNAMWNLWGGGKIV